MNCEPTTKTFTVRAPSGAATGWDMLPACPSVERNNQVRGTTDSEHGDGCSTLSGASVVRYQLHDAQGNVIGLVDNDQEVTTVYLQDSWGIPLVDTDCQTVSLASSPIQVESVPNPYRWGGAHGYYMDEDIGMYLMGFRWYDAFTGRFITRDPIGFAAGDMNQYRPMGNNPVNAVDPWGLDTFFWNFRDPEVLHIREEGPIGGAARIYWPEKDRWFSNANFLVVGRTIVGVFHYPPSQQAGDLQDPRTAVQRALAEIVKMFTPDLVEELKGAAEDKIIEKLVERVPNMHPLLRAIEAAETVKDVHDKMHELNKMREHMRTQPGGGKYREAELEKIERD